MKQELENKLAEQFGFMRRRPVMNNETIDDLYGAFGIEAGDGWYQLLYDMCSEIVNVFKKANGPVNIVVDQVKETYGTLRFYYHFEGDGLEEIAQIVDRYEDKSSTICEVCGCDGQLRNDLRWIRTLCDACYSKCNEKLKRN